MKNNILIFLLIFVSACAEENSTNTPNKKIENNIQAAWHNEINSRADLPQNLEITDKKSVLDKTLESANLGMLPYTCSPDRYPPHIILANRSCQPYLKQMYYFLNTK